MEKQFNLDLEPVKSEKDLISLVGQLLSEETPNLNLIYQDDDGMAYSYDFIDGDTGEHKYTIHSLYNKKIDKGLFEKIFTVSGLIEKGFKAKGVTSLYTWAETEEQDKFNKILGYEPTGSILNIPGYPNIVYEYKKDI